MVGGIENEGEAMPRTRKSHQPSLKAKVAVEAVEAIKAPNQVWSTDITYLPIAWRLPLPGCRHGLVQPLRARFGPLQYDPARLLFGGPRRGLPLWPTRDFGTPIRALSSPRRIFWRR